MQKHRKCEEVLTFSRLIAPQTSQVVGKTLKINTLNGLVIKNNNPIEMFISVDYIKGNRLEIETTAYGMEF